jgi:hypothetical protein
VKGSCRQDVASREAGLEEIEPASAVGEVGSGVTTGWTIMRVRRRTV